MLVTRTVIVIVIITILSSVERLLSFTIHHADIKEVFVLFILSFFFVHPDVKCGFARLYNKLYGISNISYFV